MDRQSFNDAITWSAVSAPLLYLYLDRLARRFGGTPGQEAERGNQEA